jgi:hypothetical protein
LPEPGSKIRAAGSTPALSEAEIEDLLAFLDTLSDGYQPQAR